MSSIFNTLYFHSHSGLFYERVNSLLTPIKDKSRIISLSFFGASTENTYPEELNEIKKIVAEVFNGKSPLLSYIIQSQRNADEMSVELTYIPETISSESIDFRVFGNVRYALYTCGNITFLMTEGVCGKSFFDSITTQATDIFDKIESVLTNEQIGISDIIRQWNYIGHITEIEEDIQNYQALNNARAQFYEKVKWNDGFPAATGIGMECRGLIVSLMAITNNSNKQIVSLDNPLQTPAFAYSESLLIGNQSEIIPKAPPKFERAKVISGDAGLVCFISGTAAIRDEMSMTEMNAGLQTNQIIENILYLISLDNLHRQGIVAAKSDLDITSLRVYIKNKEDFDAVKAEVEKVWNHLPIIYLRADICRKELLVEIEGMATAPE